MQMYGLRWKDDLSPVQVEMEFIRRGGYFNVKGKQYGNGLFEHYKALQTLLWPDDDWHRWAIQGLKAIVENDITVFMGASDSNKTYTMARFVLTDWWAFADRTLWMVSSTELRGAELRIWGKLKELFNRARAIHPWLPGTVLESKHAFVTDDISEDGEEARTLTRGIIFIPCKSNNKWVGMGAYCGIKPTKNGRLGHAGDEVAVMESSFLDAYSNWYGKENFRGIMSGNPTDTDDPLCTAGEPQEGWEAWSDSGKTQEWRSKWYNAWVVAFDGRDSPNFDFPERKTPKYHYLIGPKKLEMVASSEGLDSPLYWMQCVGKPRPGAGTLRVITKAICEQGRAFESVVWQGTGTVRVAACDAAYSGIGGDRCVLLRGEFGRDTDNRMVLALHPPVLVPVNIKSIQVIEDQIATYCRKWCESFDIPAENFFFDARATMAVAFARIWSPLVNPIDFGGTPTNRPVSQGEYIWEGDTQIRRLKRSDEQYSKFVTELWFSSRYAIMSKQIRQLPQDVAQEGYRRVWRFTKGSPPRIEVETKAEMKKRTSRSPDLYDAFVTLLEGARRLGFQIETMADNQWANKNQEDYLEKELTIYRGMLKQRSLSYG